MATLQSSHLNAVTQIVSWLHHSLLVWTQSWQENYKYIKYIKKDNIKNTNMQQ